MYRLVLLAACFCSQHQDIGATCLESFRADASFAHFPSSWPAASTLRPGLVDATEFWESFSAGVEHYSSQERHQWLFQLGTLAIEACGTLGGHYWEVDIGGVMGTLCAPHECNVDHIASAIAPRVLGQWAPESSAIFRQLVPWSSFELSFAIVGLESCGTTSLHMNLMEHPDIGFTTSYEDGFLTSGGQGEFFEYLGKYKVIPLKEQQELFNSRWVGGGSKPKIIGMNNPMLFTDPLAMHSIWSIAGTRIVVAVCDPLSRLEKWFHYEFCGRTTVCERNIANLLDSPDGVSFIAEHGFGEKLHALLQLFGPSRIKMIHQESLREAPQDTYNDLAAFLGASPFPDDYIMRRYNSQKGQRTGLCKHPELVQKLKQVLEPEYQMLELLLFNFGVAVPKELTQRLSRCDRPEELQVVASCPNKTQC